jgi:hypothetical protein
MTYALLFLTIFTVSETWFKHESLYYTEDDGTLTRHDLPSNGTVFNEDGYINTLIYDLYGW